MRELFYFSRFGFELFVGLYDEPGSSYQSDSGFVWNRLIVSWAVAWSASAARS